MRERMGVRRLGIVIAAFAALIGTPAAARADLGILVPSYFYPGTGGPGGSGDGWAAMTAAASQVQITAILNPDSGPLPGPADPNYTNAMTSPTSTPTPATRPCPRSRARSVLTSVSTEA
jgi:Spherulation-specific family 4